MDTAASLWRDRSVLVTGHTGFKGGWLTLWLKQLGAYVHGYSLDPPTKPSFFESANVSSALASDIRADLADLYSLQTTFKQTQPEVVFHLAAQPLVRESYREPLRTFATNIMGTAHILDAARATSSVRAVVIITTDKVYTAHKNSLAYREQDPLGGHDPYSASKAAAEIVTASYRASFFGAPNGHHAHVATARAGNVIGGGDWAEDRLVPDCLHAFKNNEAVRLRHPHAVRPWQHVLEPLSGYLALAERLLSIEGRRFAMAFNFGPNGNGDASAGEVAQATATLWGPDAQVIYASPTNEPHETELLRLDSSLAHSELNWQPRWSLQQALEYTIAWHRAWIKGEDMLAMSYAQISDYAKARAS